MTKLAPSILSADFCTLGEDIRQIAATQTQLVTLRTIVVFLIPLAVAAAGIVVFLRRRNR